MSASLKPRADYPWEKVAWSGPNSPPGELCNVCFAKLPEVPLIFCRQDGAVARFCDPCTDDLFGVKRP